MPVSIRSQPLIAVRDVRASSAWYATLLDLERTSVTMKSDHAHLYDRLLSRGALVLQLHAWDAEDHANLVGEHAAKHGHGVLLWYEVDDFDAAVQRAHALGAEIVDGPLVNSRPAHRELWLRDLDGYVVVIVSPDGEAARSVAS
jgi:catechol 2,3-dioxygenase-like lactoylglutathione lyase family enzyme